MPGGDAELLVLRGMLHVAAGDVQLAIEDLRTAFDLARAGFGFAQLPRAHLMLARALYWRGEWDESLVQSRIAQSLLDERPWMPTQPESSMTLVLAARGEWAVAEANVAAAMALAERVRTVELVTAARCAAAAVAHARGRHDEVVAVLRPLAGVATADSTPLTMLAWWPMLAGSLIGSGELAGRPTRSNGSKPPRTASISASTRISPICAVDWRWPARTPSTRGDLAAHGRRSVHPDHPVLDRALVHHAVRGGATRPRAATAGRGPAPSGARHPRPAGRRAVPPARRGRADLGWLGGPSATLPSALRADHS